MASNPPFAGDNSLRASVPQPSFDARDRSARLHQRICRHLHEAGGPITLGQFVHAALYEPELGYYAAGTRKFGESGDFVTAPELGPVFARCLARGMQRVLAQLSNATIVELGAGSGQLSYDLLLELQRLDALPRHYQILEVSAHLRARQEDLLATLPATISTQITWLSTPPTQDFDGIVFGNEVIDALPMERFRVQNDGGITIDHIALKQGQLALCDGPAPNELSQQVTRLHHQFGPWQSPYVGEIRTGMRSWINELGAHLKQGAMVFIDYGCDAADLYRADRAQGTLLCHYQHRAHEQLLLWPGLQDITSWVDFTAVADAASASGWQLNGYCSQTHLLLDLQLDEVVTQSYADASAAQRVQLASQVKRLTLPGEMGERFKQSHFREALRRVSSRHLTLVRKGGSRWIGFRW